MLVFFCKSHELYKIYLEMHKLGLSLKAAFLLKFPFHVFDFIF